MRRRVLAVTAALAFAAGGLLAGSTTAAQAGHRCADDIPCYPHVCVNTSQKPYSVYFCNG